MVGVAGESVAEDLQHLTSWAASTVSMLALGMVANLAGLASWRVCAGGRQYTVECG